MFNKSRIAWTISALFLVAVTSCSKEEPAEQSPSPSAGQILFSSEQAGLTVKSALIPNNSDFVADAGSTLKTTLVGNVTWWTKTDDKTGIYSPEARDATSGGGTQIINNVYTADNTAASTSFTAIPPMYWGAGSTPHNFYAYYPFTGGTPAAATIPIALASTQIQSAANDFTHIGGGVTPLDFLVATPILVNSPANTLQTYHPLVHLVYNHVFTIVEFDIVGSGAPLNAIQLRGTALALAGAYIDIKLPTPAPGAAYTLAGQGSKADAVIVKLTAPATLSLSIATKVYMVIYPGFAGTCNIDFSFDSGSTWKNTVSKDAPAGGFKRGQKYTIAVNAGAL